MVIGVPKEMVVGENRVGAVPATVAELCAVGHRTLVEQSAGVGSGLDDAAFREAGAEMVPTGQDVWAGADLVLKVKQPEPPEFPLLRKGQALFCYLLAASRPRLAEAMLKAEATGLCFERAEDEQGRRPLLKPMSEIAGKLAVLTGAQLLARSAGGPGVLLAGTEGADPPKVVILGGGVVGTSACVAAQALGVGVVVVEEREARREQLRREFGPDLEVCSPAPDEVRHALSGAWLLVNAVMWDLTRQDHIVTRDMLAEMPRGAVIVDVSCDRAGAIETTEPRSHDDPTYVVEGITHYAVPNMPGAVPRTATFALAAAVRPFALALANQGIEAAIRQDRVLQTALCFYGGRTTNERIARNLGLPFTPALEALGATP